MCKEMPVIPVKKVVVSKRIIGKMEGPGGGHAQRVADQKNGREEKTDLTPNCSNLEETIANQNKRSFVANTELLSTCSSSIVSAWDHIGS
jgi:hypothetical protein